METKYRHYTSEPGMTEDQRRVRDFFLRLGYAEYTYARWDWMATHGNLDRSAVGRIGLWEEGDRVVGVSTFDTRLGNAYCLALPERAALKRDLLLHAREHLSQDGPCRVVISDTDADFQQVAAELGFVATEDKESDAVFLLDRTSTDYVLPEGFRITTMAETYDPYQYRRVLWKGFNHELNGEGEATFTPEHERAVHEEMRRPFVDLDLKVAVVSPEGNFVSYCGMWYDAVAGFAVVEPVATDPAYRRMGLGRAAVLEGIRRVGERGAKRAFVGSSQQFYYSIGMRPFATATAWRSR